MTTFTLRSDMAPGRIAINARDRARGWLDKATRKVQARVYVTTEWKAAVASVVDDFIFGWSPRAPLAGPVRVHLMSFWPRMKRKGPDAGLAYGDVDATIKAVLDALKKAAVVEDDGQVVECVLRKQHGKPGLVVTIECVDSEQGGLF